MNLMLILLSMMMTFTVSSKNAVSVSGASLNDMGVNYNCTYQKGDVRAGDTATLQLSGLENIHIDSVQLYLRSNKSSGAGEITMIADGDQLYQTKGRFIDWFNAYDNGNYHSIGWTGNHTLKEGELSIQLIGTENSLHIEKYVITYTQPQPQCYSLTLHESEETLNISESEIGSGVELPDCEDRGNWYFVGWSTSDVKEWTETPPNVHLPGERYYPTKDMDMWAVWTDVKPMKETRQTEPETGYYILELGGYLLSGIVNNNAKLLLSEGAISSQNLYHLSFSAANSTFEMRNYERDTYIGYKDSGTQLKNAQSTWHYRLLQDSTWLIYSQQIGEEYYALFIKGGTPVAELMKSTLGTNPQGLWTLYPMPDPEQTQHWWSHPWPTAIESPNATEREMIIHFGIYELHIKNGIKQLRFR